jgi:hypothetical protein
MIINIIICLLKAACVDHNHFKLVIKKWNASLIYSFYAWILVKNKTLTKKKEKKREKTIVFKIAVNGDRGSMSILTIIT